ncbi:MAG: stage V sporulation T C-terminal domain-containing protein, partial [Oscillospiraceae bacterium]|nr:stage V sporulation T C-terminal domain-containing protein [Oscillospiraceae bacterium]
RAAGMPVLICDRDHIVAVAGVSRKEFMERRISSQMEEIIDQRRTKVAVAGEAKRTQPVEGVDRYAGVIAPIIAAGDVIGAVCLLLPESGAVPNEGDVKLAQVAAAFLGKQMEE